MAQPERDNLFNALKGTKYYVGDSIDEFNEAMQDPETVEYFYRNVGQQYDLGDFEDFRSKVMDDYQPSADTDIQSDDVEISDKKVVKKDIKENELTTKEEISDRETVFPAKDQEGTVTDNGGFSDVDAAGGEQVSKSPSPAEKYLDGIIRATDIDELDRYMSTLKDNTEKLGSGRMVDIYNNQLLPAYQKRFDELSRQSAERGAVAGDRPLLGENTSDDELIMSEPIGWADGMSDDAVKAEYEKAQTAASTTGDPDVKVQSERRAAEARQELNRRAALDRVPEGGTAVGGGAAKYSYDYSKVDDSSFAAAGKELRRKSQNIGNMTQEELEDYNARVAGYNAEVKKRAEKLKTGADKLNDFIKDQRFSDAYDIQKALGLGVRGVKDAPRVRKTYDEFLFSARRLGDTQIVDEINKYIDKYGYNPPPTASAIVNAYLSVLNERNGGQQALQYKDIILSMITPEAFKNMGGVRDPKKFSELVRHYTEEYFSGSEGFNTRAEEMSPDAFPVVLGREIESQIAKEREELDTRMQTIENAYKFAPHEAMTARGASLAIEAEKVDWGAVANRALTSFGGTTEQSLAKAMAYTFGKAAHDYINIESAQAKVDELIKEETEAALKNQGIITDNIPTAVLTVTNAIKGSLFGQVFDLAVKFGGGTLGTDKLSYSRILEQQLQKFSKEHPALNFGSHVAGFALDLPFFKVADATARFLVRGASGLFFKGSVEGTKLATSMGTKEVTNLAINNWLRSGAMPRIAFGAGKGFVVGAEYGGLTSTLSELDQKDFSAARVALGSLESGVGFALADGLGAFFGRWSGALDDAGWKGIYRNGSKGGRIANFAKGVLVDYGARTATTSLAFTMPTPVFEFIKEKSGLRRDGEQSVSFGDAYLDNLALMSVLGLPGLIGEAKARRYENRTGRRILRGDWVLSDEDLRILREHGYQDFSEFFNSEFQKVPDEWYNAAPFSGSEHLISGRGTELSAGAKKNLNVYGVQRFREMMLNRDIPLEQRAKVAAIFTGENVTLPAAAGARVIKSGTTVEVLDAGGAVIAVRDFGNSHAAKEYYDDVMNGAWKNTMYSALSLAKSTEARRLLMDSVKSLVVVGEQHVSPQSLLQMYEDAALRVAQGVGSKSDKTFVKHVEDRARELGDGELYTEGLIKATEEQFGVTIEELGKKHYSEFSENELEFIDELSRRILNFSGAHILRTLRQAARFMPEDISASYDASVREETLKDVRKAWDERNKNKLPGSGAQAAENTQTDTPPKEDVVAVPETEQPAVQEHQPQEQAQTPAVTPSEPASPPVDEQLPQEPEPRPAQETKVTEQPTEPPVEPAEPQQVNPLPDLPDNRWRMKQQEGKTTYYSRSGLVDIPQGYELDEGNMRLPDGMTADNVKETGISAIVVDGDGNISAITEDRRGTDAGGYSATITVPLRKVGEQAGDAAETPTVVEAVPETPAEAVELSPEDKAVADANQQYLSKESEPIKQKWGTAKRFKGNKYIYVTEDGTRYEAHFELMEADAATPSHVPFTFGATPGFPTTPDGKTANDRDYEHDANAQATTTEISNNFDTRALKNLPVLEPTHGFNVSGDGTDIASQMAAVNGTDGAYLNDLPVFTENSGIDPAHIAELKHPRLRIVLDHPIPLTTDIYHSFNKEGKKGQDVYQKGVMISKSEAGAKAAAEIGGIAMNYDRLSDMANDPKASKEIIDVLRKHGVIGSNEIAGLMVGNKLSGTGKDLVEALVLGSVLDQDAINALSAAGMGEVKEKLTIAGAALLENSRLKKGKNGEDYSLGGILSSAVRLLQSSYAANNDGGAKEDALEKYLIQPNLLNNGLAPQQTESLAVQLLAKLMSIRGSVDLRKMIQDYNERATDAANGQIDLLTASIDTPEQLLKDLVTLILKKHGKELRTTAKPAERQPAAGQVKQPDEDIPSAGGDEKGAGGGRPVAGAAEEPSPRAVEGQAAPQPKKVNVESLIGELNEKGEAKLSDHADDVNDVPSDTEGSANGSQSEYGSWYDALSDEEKAEFDALKEDFDQTWEELKDRTDPEKQGIADDPEAKARLEFDLTVKGAKMLRLMFKGGLLHFRDVAMRLLKMFGEKIRPYLKNIYIRAYGDETLPDNIVDQLDDPRTVRRFDVSKLEEEKPPVKNTATPLKSEKENVSLQEQTIPDSFSGLFGGEDNSLETRNKGNYDTGRTHRQGSDGVSQGASSRSGSVNNRGLDSNIPERRHDEQGNSNVQSTAEQKRSSLERPAGRSEGLTEHKPEPAPLAESERKNTHNNHAERGTDYAPKGTNARIEANIKAIETMQRLIESGQPATPEDMSVLRKFSGWGGLGAAFKEKVSSGDSGYNPRLRDDYQPANPINARLRELLSPEAYEAANMSRNSAYYTPAPVIDAMWDVARAMGFRGGNVLEGSAGIGNIIGLMPTDMSERSNIHAVEIDETTGNILSLLYPDANVEVKGFEKTFVPNGSVDLAITNVPFVTGLRVMDETGDKDLSRKFHDIHDFCIAKNVRKLKEGGVGIFITSSGTLDSPNSAKLRTWLVNEGGADVVGAFRMHNQTFGGTGATSDIIVIRKRVNGRKSANAIDVSGTLPIRTVKYNTGETKRGSSEVIIKDLALDVNKHFVEHPEDMAGEMAFAFEKGDTYRATSKALYPSPSINQEQRLSEWAQQFKDMDWDKAEERESQQVVYEDLGEDVKEGSMLLDSDGNLCLAQRGKAVPINVNANKVKGHTKAECFNAYKAIKDALADVLEYQTTHSDDNGLQQRLAKLNKAYDSFVKTYGHLNKNTSISFLRNDMDYPSIAALESVSETGDKNGKRIVTYGKTDIFSRRVVETESEPKPTTIKDGIIASIYLNGRVDVPYIAEQLNMSDSDVRQQIIESGLGFENPTTTEMEVSYEYLSGNVREKLRQAQENNTDGRYDANIKALERVIPMNIPAHLIEFTLGSSWVEPKLYEDFVKERTGLDVKLTNAGGTWIMSEPYYTNTEQNRAMGVISEKCDKTIYGHELIKAAITCKSISVTKTISTGYGSSKTTETIVDKEATMACANKIDEIRQDFKDWARGKMQGDPEMSERMERVYNELFNNSVPKEIPDDFVPEHFGGAATVVNGKPFKLRPHQAKAVIRATTQPLMLAHEVGTGKTYTLISTAMEMRRLGTARKPMIVVQNATVGQFVASAKALYPNAKILTLEDADRNAEGRRNFYAKIRYNDWDMIVVPQSVFERIPDSEERQIRFIEDKVEEKMMVLEKMREAANDDRDPVLRQAQRELDQLNDELNDLKLALQERKAGGETEKDEKREAMTRQNAMVKAQEMLDRETDDVANFDDMGIDALLIDEAHEYKHLGFATAMQRGVKGVDPSYSKKSQGVYLKTQAVLESKNGKNVVFATGTPISNTAAEIWTFMRYLMPADTMREYGIYYFDDFVRNFGNIQQMLEFATNGKYKENNRFAGYVNLPELVRIWAGVADTVLTREAGGVSDKIPKMEGGKAQDIYLPQTKALRGVMKFVTDQLDDYEKMSGKEKKENSHIPLVMYGIAKAAAVDARLVLEDAADEPNSKTNEAVRQTLRSLEDTKEYNGTVAIFADNYQNKATGFNLYEDIRKKLIDAGVPEAQVVVMKSGMSIKKKLEIFDKVNRGEVRVIMGSTFTLGTGVNIQERLHTLIHVDAPNRPMDYTQRNGRILRQGNLHNEWGIPVRVLRFGVEDSLDVTAYQRLKTKGAIADSIMEGKKMMSNSMENRVLEEEQDLFGDITAQLSGSQYALLKNQVEKEVKKLEARKKQWEADQTYVHNQKPRLKALIKDSEERAERNKKALAKVEAAKNDGITIGGKNFPSLEAMADYIKVYNSKQREQQEQVRTAPGYNSEVKSDLTISVGGFDFHLHRVISKEQKQEKGQLSLSFFSKTQMTYSCPELGLEDVPVDGQRLKSALEDILENVLSGDDFREKAEYADRAAERYKGELQQVEARDGKPFEYADELKQAKEKLAEYEELMKAEMAEKEAKYAEMDASVEAAKGVQLSDEDSDDVTEDTAKYRIREEEPPTKTGIGYKVFVLKDGKLYPPMVANPNGEATPVGVWLDADAAPVAGVTKTGRQQVKAGGKGTQGGSGKLAYRPGWHLGEIPYALQFNRMNPETGQRELFPANFVWAEVEYANDVDYQEEAMSYGMNASGKFQHSLAGLPRLPENGSYRYRTNPDPNTDPWVITGAMKVNRILKPSEVDAMVEAAGREPQQRQAGAITDEQVEALNAKVKRTMQEDRDMMRTTAEQMGAKLNTPINIIEDVNDITHPNKEIEANRRKSKGWYDTATGQVNIVLDNNRDIDDVKASVWHETIAHKGLREMIGEERYNEFLDEVYAHLRDDLKIGVDDAAGRAFIDDTTKNGKRAKSYEHHRRTAVDELFGRLAEKPFEEFNGKERNLWQWLKAKVRHLLNRFLGSLKLPKWFELGDNELRYILWRSKERLERGKEHPIDLARDIVKREELGLTDEARYNMGYTPDTFKERQQRAVVDVGTVMPGLNDAQVGEAEDIQPLGRAATERGIADFERETGIAGAVEISSAEQIPNTLDKDTTPAWYDNSTGKVHIIPERVGTAANAKRILFHELKGHKGINELIGEERLQEFFKSVFDNLMDDGQRERWRENVRNTQDDKTKEPDDWRVASEWVANMAENGAGERPNLWGRIVGWFRHHFHKWFGFTPTMRDINYLLWKGAMRLAGKDSGIGYEVREKGMRRAADRDRQITDLNREAMEAYDAQPYTPDQHDTLAESKRLNTSRTKLQQLNNRIEECGRLTGLIDEYSADLNRVETPDARKSKVEWELKERMGLTDWTGTGDQRKRYSKRYYDVGMSDAEAQQKLADLRVAVNEERQRAEDAVQNISADYYDVSGTLPRQPGPDQSELVLQYTESEYEQALNDAERAYNDYNTSIGGTPTDKEQKRQLAVLDAKRIIARTKLDNLRNNMPPRYPELDPGETFDDASFRAKVEDYERKNEDYKDANRKAFATILEQQDRIRLLEGQRDIEQRDQDLMDQGRVLLQEEVGIDISDKAAARAVTFEFIDRRRQTIQLGQHDVSVRLDRWNEAIENHVKSEHPLAVGGANPVRTSAVKAIKRDMINWIERTEETPAWAVPIVNEIREYLDSLHTMQADEGYISPYQYEVNYITHVWDLASSLPDGEAYDSLPVEQKEAVDRKARQADLRAALENGDLLQRDYVTNRYLRSRSIPTYKWGIEHGLVPKYDSYDQIIYHYAMVAIRQHANDKLISLFRNVFWDITDRNGKVIGRKPILMYATREDEAVGRGYSAPNSIVLASKNVYVLDKAKHFVDAVFGNKYWIGHGPFHAIGKGFDSVTGYMKMLKLSLSAFHALALTEGFSGTQRGGMAGAIYQSLGHVVWSSLRTGKLPVVSKPQVAEDAIRYGVHFGGSSDYSAKEMVDINRKLSDWFFNSANKQWRDFMTAGSDYAAGNVLSQVLEGMVKIPLNIMMSAVNYPLGTAFRGLSAVAKANNFILWDLLHDSYKLLAWEHLSKKVRADAAKRNLSDGERYTMLRNLGQLINDVFGGQNWEVLNVTPGEIHSLQRILLSMDWNISVVRHLGSLLGYGTFYNWGAGGTGRYAWVKSALKTPFSRRPAVSTRRRRGLTQYLVALTWVIAASSLMNLCSRKLDMDKMEDDVAKGKREVNPYKQLDMGVALDQDGDTVRDANGAPVHKIGVKNYDMSTPEGWADILRRMDEWAVFPGAGNLNAPGKGDYIFGWHDNQGREIYFRQGKQFREGPELFFDEFGNVSIPGTFFNKITGKFNPFASVIQNVVYGRSWSGDFQNEDITKAVGTWDQTTSRVSALLKEFTPLSTNTNGKDFSMFNLVSQASFGMTFYKGKAFMKQALLNNDRQMYDDVVNALMLSGISVDDVVKAVKAELNADRKNAIKKEVRNEQDAIDLFNSATTAEERRIAMRKLELYRQHETANRGTDAYQASERGWQALTGEAPTTKQDNIYIMLMTGNDMAADQAIAEAKQKYKQGYDRFKEARKSRNAQAISNARSKYMSQITAYSYLDKTSRAMTKLKKTLKGDGGESDRNTMQRIRELRKNALDKVAETE